MEHLFAFVAVCCYFISAIRILCFENYNSDHKRKHELLAFVLIASFMGQSVNILFLKDPVTVWDAIFGMVLFGIIWTAKGNVAQLFKGKNA